jgi:predicted secreted protein
MSFRDRLMRSLFVASAVGLGWGIRGDFGHSLGAMAPGATLGLAFAYVAGQRSTMKWMPILAGLGAFFMSLGGMMSYGVLHGYAQADTLLNYGYGFLTLLLQGGAWGGFAGAALGLVLESRRLTVGEVISAAATSFGTGWIVYYVVVEFLGFHINPPRSDLSINFIGQMAGLSAWMIFNKRWTGLRGQALGFMGFGLGMALGRLAANAIQHAPFTINHWNVMEVSCGFIGGLVFAFGMLGQKLDELPDEPGWPGVGAWSIFYVMGFIPWLHRLTRIRPEKKLEEWTASLMKFGVEEVDRAQTLAELTLSGVDGLCALGFVAAIFWFVLWKRNQERWCAYPVLMFSLLMLLFQNLTSLYFWETFPGALWHVNMHTVFWWLFGYMLLFVVVFEGFRRRADDGSVASGVVDQAEVRLPWRRWIFVTATIFAGILVAASFTNGDKTMKTANTRLPIWSWNDGPFPGRTETSPKP